jgi:hypothetical protein
MTWHIKPKKPVHEQAPPEPCFRCGRQMGNTQLTVVNTSKTPASNVGAIWLCEECRAEIAREGGKTN